MYKYRFFVYKYNMTDKKHKNSNEILFSQSITNQKHMSHLATFLIAQTHLPSQLCRRTYGWTDGWTDLWTDRQTLL